MKQKASIEGLRTIDHDRRQLLLLAQSVSPAARVRWRSDLIDRKVDRSVIKLTRTANRELPEIA